MYNIGNMQSEYYIHIYNLKKHKIFIIKRYEVKDEYYIFTYLN